MRITKTVLIEKKIFFLRQRQKEFMEMVDDFSRQVEWLQLTIDHCMSAIKSGEDNSFDMAISELKQYQWDCYPEWSEWEGY